MVSKKDPEPNVKVQLPSQKWGAGVGEHTETGSLIASMLQNKRDQLGALLHSAVITLPGRTSHSFCNC